MSKEGGREREREMVYKRNGEVAEWEGGCGRCVLFMAKVRYLALIPTVR